MRSDNSAYAALRLEKSKQPRYTVEVAFQENVASGTAQSATSTTLRLASTNSALTDAYNDMVVTITGGTGSGQKRTITAYDDVTKDITVAAWTTTPDNTSTYRIDDVYYMTSHPQADSAIVAGAPVEYDCIRDLSGTSQQLYPDEARATIGTIDFAVIDPGSALTTKIYTKLTAGYGLKGKRVRVYMGFDGLTFDEYILRATQIVDMITASGPDYQFRCADINRTVRKDIFDLKTTNLAKSITASQLLIPVYSVTGFSLVAHGTSYSDAPSRSVLYIKVEKEVIRCTGTTTDANLGLCFVADQRGALNTLAVAHNIDESAAQDRRTKVEEYVYIEMPAVKLAYAILTGTLYGQGASLPSGWNLAISTDYVRLADFTGIGTDLWNTADDTKGFVVRFEGLKKQDAKAFLEKEVYLLLGAFSPIYADGALGLKRMTGVLSSAATLITLDSSNIVSHGDLTHDLSRVKNQILIEWNWETSQDDFTRSNLLIDADSISTHGRSTLTRLKFRGLHGSRHSYAALTNRFAVLRDRYAGPPIKLDIRVLPSLDVIEVGDIVRVDLDTLRDFTSGSTLDRAFEVQSVKTNWITGEVSLSLFGSSQAASVITPDSTGSGGTGTATPPLADSWYASEGNSLTTYLDANYPGTYTDVGGILTITGNCTLTGNASLASAIYYYAGDITINSAVIVTITQNVQIRYRGHLTINGKIDGKGGGHAGSANGTAGFFCHPEAGGGQNDLGPYSFRGTTVAGTHSVIPVFDVYTTGGALSGQPTDLRGSAGGKGGNVYNVAAGSGGYTATGGNGGAGGAGLLLVGRGMSFGVNGQIDLSGGDGSLGGSVVDPINSRTRYAGTGAGGAPGALVVFLDGSASNIPSLGTPLVQTYGASTVQGTPLPSSTAYRYDSNVYVDSTYPAYSYYIGNGGQDLGQSAYRIQFLPENTAASSNVDAPPPNVANLRINFISGLAQINWDAISSAVSFDYEVRMGTSWATGRVLGRTPLTQFPYYGDGTYWVAARYVNASGVNVYSVTPTSITVSGGAITSNVLASYDEDSLGWLGTVADGCIVSGANLVLMGSGNVLDEADYLAITDLLWLGGIAPSGTYTIPTDHRVDVGRPAPCNILISVSAAVNPVYDNILDEADILAVTDYLSYALTGKISVTPQIRIAQADGVYGDWQNYVPGQYYAQHFDSRLLLETTDDQVSVLVSNYTFQVDMPDRVDTGTSVSVDAAGTAVAFSSPFNIVPNVHITILNAQAGDTVTFPVQPTVNGFTVQITNAAVGVARTVNWVAQGY